MEIGPLAFTLRPTGRTKTLTMTVNKSVLEAPVTLSELETVALFFAAQVGKWRDELIEAEGARPQTEVS